jgi:hypothetical protein
MPRNAVPSPTTEGSTGGASAVRRRVVPLLVAAAILCGGAGPAVADGEATVQRASIRFGLAAGDDPAGVPGTVRLRALLEDPASLAAYDPAAGGVSAFLGRAVLLDVPEGEAADVRRRRNGAWRLETRGPDRRRTRLAYDPGTGRLDIVARDADLTRLAESGPSGVDLEIRLGSEIRTRVLEFRESSTRRWTFREGGGPGIAPSGDSVAFEPIDSGARSGMADPLETVVTDAASWEELWTSTHAFGEPVPDVDFRTESVVGVFLGTRPTTGYAVEILAIESRADALDVSWRETAPGEDCVVLQALTSPYVLVRVPVPGARAGFAGSKVVVPCGR